MAGAVQWTIDQLWKGLQSLQLKINAVDADLQADKLQLAQLYTATRKVLDPMGAHDRALLDPQIRRNTELRLNYLAPVKNNYAKAVSAASAALKAAGYTTPGGLSGLGVAFVVAPAAAVVLVTVALAAIAAIALLTQAQRNRTSALKTLLGDQNSTPEQKAALLAEMKQAIDAEAKLPGALGSFSWLVPALAIVALIVLGPQLMRMLPRRTA
jgi:hypothetical protein